MLNEQHLKHIQDMCDTFKKELELNSTITFDINLFTSHNSNTFIIYFCKKKFIHPSYRFNGYSKDYWAYNSQDNTLISKFNTDYCENDNTKINQFTNTVNQYLQDIGYFL